MLPLYNVHGFIPYYTTVFKDPKYICPMTKYPVLKYPSKNIKCIKYPVLDYSAEITKYPNENEKCLLIKKEKINT